VTEEYQYNALKGRVLSMRLLALLPGTRQEDIALRLYETNLDECAGSYGALSYVWGDQTEQTPVLIDGKTLEIGSNLRSALLNLRLLDEPRILWTDAICIDQSNLDERNQQVAAMGEIYRRAARTIIWLGEPEEETAEAFSMLENLAEEAVSLAQVESSPSAIISDSEQSLAPFNDYPLSLVERDDINTPMFYRYMHDYSILHIMFKPWWYRTWTIQEILLASSATVMAGRHAIDWDRFCTGGNHGLKLGLWMPKSMGIILDPIVAPYLSLQSLSRNRRRGSTAPPAHQLLEMLVHFRSHRATEPSDKIYALLGLLDKPSLPSHDPSLAPPLGIRPDYANPTDAVYGATARQILLESDTLDILGACSSAPTTSQGPPLPSWVPDWRQIAMTAAPLMHDALGQMRGTHAANHTAAAPQFINDNATLVLQGSEVTELVALAPSLARIEFSSFDMVNRLKGDIPAEGSPGRWMVLLGIAWAELSTIYETYMSVVPHLATYAAWEAFAREVDPTNPMPSLPGNEPQARRSRPERVAPIVNTIRDLVHPTTNLSVATNLRFDGRPGKDEEPDDPLAVYWQTLCTGTYVTDAEAEAVAPGRGGKIATQQLFYSWRASLKPIRDLHRWHGERRLRPLGFIGYLRKTWRGYGEFVRFVEGVYERRLARGANGYLCLVPAAAEAGDRLILAKGGRVPLVLRRDGESEYWRLVGEAYVHGIMDGEAWDGGKCVEFKLK